MGKSVRFHISICILVICISGVVTSCLSAENPISADELLELGEKYLLELDYETAIICFKELIEIEPNNVRAFIGLADAYIGLDDIDAAIEALEYGLEESGGRSAIQRKLDRLLLDASSANDVDENANTDQPIDATASAVPSSTTAPTPNTNMIDEQEQRYTAVELADYIGEDLSYVNRIIGNLNNANATDGIEFINSDLWIGGNSNDISNATFDSLGISNTCDYSLFGIRYGSGINEAENALLNSGWELIETSANGILKSKSYRSNSAPYRVKYGNVRFFESDILDLSYTSKDTIVNIYLSVSGCESIADQTTPTPTQALAPTHPNDQANSFDSETYRNYLLNGGYEELIPIFLDDGEHNWKNIKIFSCMPDFDGDGNKELLISFANESMAGPRGFPQIDILLCIQNGNVRELIREENGGGSAGGAELYFCYDTVSEKYVLISDGYYRSGITYAFGNFTVYTYENGLLSIAYKVESTYIDEDYGNPADIEKIKSETSLIFKDGINGLTVYQINGVYVTDTEYANMIERFVAPADNTFLTSAVSRSNPIP